MKPGRRTDLDAWIALLVLLAITCGSSYIPMRGLNIAVNLGVAVLKALIVVLVFMHVARGRAVIRMAAAAGFVWLAILAGLSTLDFAQRYASRGDAATNPPVATTGAPRAG